MTQLYGINPSKTGLTGSEDLPLVHYFMSSNEELMDEYLIYKHEEYLDSLVFLFYCQLTSPMHPKALKILLSQAYKLDVESNEKVYGYE